MTASAALEVRTRRCNPIRRRLNNRLNLASRKAALRFCDPCLDDFVFQNEGHKHRLPAIGFVGWQTGESIAAVNQFLNAEFQ